MQQLMKLVVEGTTTSHHVEAWVTRKQIIMIHRQASRVHEVISKLPSEQKIRVA